MTVGQVPRSRSQTDPTLTAEELTEFRSCCGSLQWLAGQTRPDIIASAVSLSSKGLETKVDDLKRLYRLMSYVKATSDLGITLKPIKLNSETVIVSCGDCSWANAEGMKSQEGIIVVLSSKDCLEGQARCIPMDWKTCRTPRVVRSTLAGEAYAADDAIDRGHHVNATLTEILTGESILNTGPILKHAHATDCRIRFGHQFESEHRGEKSAPYDQGDPRSTRSENDALGAHGQDDCGYLDQGLRQLTVEFPSVDEKPNVSAEANR